LKILQVSHQYRPAIGGAERYVTDLSEELARRGHRVEVYTSQSLDYRAWRSELPAAETLDGVKVFRFRSLPRTGFTWRVLSRGLNNYRRSRRGWYEPLILYGNGPLCPGMFAAMLRHARQFDVIHINNLHYAHALTAYAAATLRDVPLLITPHLHAEQWETHDVGYMRRILRGSAAVLAVTRAEKRYLLDRGWNSEVIVGGNGLRLDRFPPLDQSTCRARFGLPDNAFVILFLGRKTEYKGLDTCAEAFAALRQSREDVYFLAVGPETAFSQSLWKRYADVDGLVVEGEISNEERLKALAACDVLALPSAAEAFGIVYLEAWAYRRPVIGASIPSVSSVVTTGEDGLLVEPGRIRPLVGAFSHLADHPQERQQMGKRGRAKLKRRYTVARIASIFEATSLRVLRKRRTLSTTLRQEGMS
jgi:glycosyltransferase involved in cell wall biosynthesis